MDYEEENQVTNLEMKMFLETLAKLIEATAKTPEEAAEIVRNAIDDMNK